MLYSGKESVRMATCGYVRVSSADQNEDRQSIVMSKLIYNERDSIKKRKVEGIAAARMRGIHLERIVKKSTFKQSSLALIKSK